MLDRDLAELYGVPTKALNQAVKRNIERFPSEFMFMLHAREMSELVTNCDRFKSMKHSSVPMRAFTEYGIIMLASVLVNQYGHTSPGRFADEGVRVNYAPSTNGFTTAIPQYA